jgi:hypothetical protein
VQAVIVAATKKIASPDELSVCFLQAGDDSKAAAYLAGLDAKIPGAAYDIVKSMPLSEVEKYPTTEALIAAILEH